jgi:hypothetical protein
MGLAAEAAAKGVAPRRREARLRGLAEARVRGGDRWPLTSPPSPLSREERGRQRRGARNILEGGGSVI